MWIDGSVLKQEPEAGSLSAVPAADTLAFFLIDHAAN